MPNPNAPLFFRCPNCNALYQVVRAKAGPETVDLEAACGLCGEALVAREGQFVLKYYLLRKAIREDSLLPHYREHFRGYRAFTLRPESSAGPARASAQVRPGHGSAPSGRRVLILQEHRPSRKTRFSSQPLDLAWNFPPSCSSMTTVRWSVLRMICRSRSLLKTPPTATEIPQALKANNVTLWE
jgi:predicted Zn finger-like uncharacterized protein